MYLRGRDGIEVRARTNWAWQFEDGWLVRFFAFNEIDDGLGAVGLSE
jgi:hypothetical protein